MPPALKKSLSHDTAFPLLFQVRVPQDSFWVPTIHVLSRTSYRFTASNTTDVPRLQLQPGFLPKHAGYTHTSTGPSEFRQSPQFSSPHLYIGSSPICTTSGNSTIMHLLLQRELVLIMIPLSFISSSSISKSYERHLRSYLFTSPHTFCLNPSLHRLI